MQYVRHTCSVFVYVQCTLYVYVRTVSVIPVRLVFVQLAAEIAAPLSKVDEMVLLGGEDKITSELTRLVGQVPPAVNALTGVDLSKVS